MPSLQWARRRVSAESKDSAPPGYDGRKHFGTMRTPRSTVALILSWLAIPIAVCALAAPPEQHDVAAWQRPVAQAATTRENGSAYVIDASLPSGSRPSQQDSPAPTPTPEGYPFQYSPSPGAPTPSPQPGVGYPYPPPAATDEPTPLPGPTAEPDTPTPAPTLTTTVTPTGESTTLPSPPPAAAAAATAAATTVLAQSATPQPKTASPSPEPLATVMQTMEPPPAPETPTTPGAYPMAPPTMPSGPDEETDPFVSRETFIGLYALVAVAATALTVFLLRRGRSAH